MLSQKTPCSGTVETQPPMYQNYKYGVHKLNINMKINDFYNLTI